MDRSIQDTNWKSLDEKQQIKIQEQYNQLFDADNEDKLFQSYEIEEKYGEHNLKLRKLYTCLYDRCYSGGMALIAARNFKEAMEIISKDWGSWDRSTMQEVDDAIIYVSFSHIIREGSYAE